MWGGGEFNFDRNFVLLTSYYRNKKLVEDATATMIRGTAVRPEERRRKILESLQLVFLITLNLREIVWALSIWLLGKSPLTLRILLSAPLG